MAPGAPIRGVRPSGFLPRLARLVASGHSDDKRLRPPGAGLCDVVELRIDRAVVDRVHLLRPAIVLVDLDGGQFDVVRLCRAVRTVSDAWIVVMSATAIDDALVVDALDAGADDVVIAASPAVIDARLRVGLRSGPTAPEPPPVIAVGDVEIDLRAHELRIAGAATRCPPVQFELLHALARRSGAVVGSEELLRTIWGAASGDINPRRLRIAVSVARHIIGRSPTRPRLETVTRVGYRLVAPVRP